MLRDQRLQIQANATGRTVTGPHAERGRYPLAALRAGDHRHTRIALAHHAVEIDERGVQVEHEVRRPAAGRQAVAVGDGLAPCLAP